MEMKYVDNVSILFLFTCKEQEAFSFFSQFEASNIDFYTSILFKKY